MEYELKSLSGISLPTHLPLSNMPMLGSVDYVMRSRMHYYGYLDHSIVTLDKGWMDILEWGPKYTFLSDGVKVTQEYRG
jgi:hypothetical protein